MKFTNIKCEINKILKFTVNSNCIGVIWLQSILITNLV